MRRREVSSSIDIKMEKKENLLLSEVVSSDRVSEQTRIRSD